MTAIAAVDFDAGPAGANINGAAVAGTNEPQINGAQSGTRPVFSTDIPPSYTDAGYSAQVDMSGVTSFNNATFATQTGLWIGFYFTLLATTAADSFFLNWYSSAGTKVGDLKWTGGAATMGIRDNNTTQATSPAFALTTWHRAAVQVTPGSATGHRLKLYLGSNRHGTTADYDSGGQTATSAAQTDVGGFRFGLLSGTETHYRIARIRVDTAEPAGIAVPATVSEFWLDSGGWRSTTEKFLSSTGVWT